VYFGTATTPPLVTNTANFTYTPAPLSAKTTYYWAIGARNNLGANASAAWSFTTGCLSSLNPSSATAAAAGGNGTVPVTASAGCGWTAVSNATWITVISGASGSGNGTVGYAVAPDTGALRVGTITIADQTFTVTQGGVYPLISTLAGGTMPPTPAPGTSVSIPTSYGVAVDSSGNTYFPSPNLNAVFMAGPTGVVTRIAGTGVGGYSGDSGPALSAQLNGPTGVALDASGNVYIADSNNQRIREVSTSGIITTVAGNGVCCGFSGDGGPAIGAGLYDPTGVAVDAAGNLYIGDTNNQRIRKVATTGIIDTVAGNGTGGYSGDGGAATTAELYNPYGVAVDAPGNLYIADSNNLRIRKVNTSGVITTVAGNGSCCDSGDGGAATSAQLSYPYGVALDTAGNLYIADSGNLIRKVSAGIITTVAGSGGNGFSGDGGAATSAQFRSPEGVAVDASGDLYIADSGNARIREVNAAGTIATLVGGATGDGGLGVFGYFNQPSGVARDKAGNTWVADANNNRVRKVAANGTMTTVAGTGTSGFSGDAGPAASAQLNSPQGLVLDASGNLFIADSGNSRIRKVDGSGNITTVAGNGGYGYKGDGGAATSAQLSYPTGVAVDAAGDLYVADVNNQRIRKVSAAGIITTLAGNGTYGYSGDGGVATSAQLNYPNGVAVDATGNLYIADTLNSRIRKVVATGIITTTAGNGTSGFSGDGGAATTAQLSNPAGVALDAADDLYIADNGNSRIRKVASSGTITTIAGNGDSGYSGDGELATGATFQNPYGVSVDASGNVAVADQNNNAVRLLIPTATQPVLTIQSAHAGTFTPGQTGATYTLTVTNGSGAGPTSGTATVTEILPAGLTLASMAGTGWTCTAAPTCTRSDALNGGSSYPAITVTVNVSATAPGQLTNQASVSGGGAAAGGATDLTVVTAPPAAPVLVSPANGASSVLLAPSLTWNASTGATSYAVYFGTASTPPPATTTTNTSYTPGTLSEGTTYYWQIVAKNGSGTASSAIWSFTTSLRPGRGR
jgi:hypothetical protein